MSGSVLAAGIPFLGPAVAAWVALIVGVMAFYALSVSRQYRTRGVQDPPEWHQSTSVEARYRNEPPGSPWFSQPDPMQPSQESFRSDVRQVGGSQVQRRSELPAYDMETYPDEKWGTPVNTPTVSGRDHA